MPSSDPNRLSMALGAARDKPVASLLNLAMIGMLAAFLLTPIVLAIAQAFQVRGESSATMYWFGRLWEDDTRELLINGVLLAALSTLICLVISIPPGDAPGQVQLLRPGRPRRRRPRAADPPPPSSAPWR